MYTTTTVNSAWGLPRLKDTFTPFLICCFLLCWQDPLFSFLHAMVTCGNEENQSSSIQFHTWWSLPTTVHFVQRGRPVCLDVVCAEFVYLPESFMLSRWERSVSAHAHLHTSFKCSWKRSFSSLFLNHFVRYIKIRMNVILTLFLCNFGSACFCFTHNRKRHRYFLKEKLKMCLKCLCGLFLNWKLMTRWFSKLD